MKDRADADERGIGRRRVLKTGIGALAVGATGLSVTGTAAAHFPEQLDVDVVPGSDENTVNPNGYGVVPVAVHATEYEDEGETVVFDPTEEPVRYRFGASDVVGDGDGARPVHDGHTVGDSLFLLFRVDETGIDEETTDVRLEWERDESGEHGLSGTDSVTVVDPWSHGWHGHGTPGRHGPSERDGPPERHGPSERDGPPGGGGFGPGRGSNGRGNGWNGF